MEANPEPTIEQALQELSVTVDEGDRPLPAVSSLRDRTCPQWRSPCESAPGLNGWFSTVDVIKIVGLAFSAVDDSRHRGAF